MNSNIFKIIKNNIFGIIIGGILLGTIGVAAATYLYDSSQISFSNENTSATNVKSAIDELYSIIPNFPKDSLKLIYSEVSGSWNSTNTLSTNVEPGTYILCFQQISVSGGGTATIYVGSNKNSVSNGGMITITEPTSIKYTVTTNVAHVKFFLIVVGVPD